MTCDTRAQPDWKAPADDGQVLLWPEAGELLAQTIDNHSHLRACDSVRFQGVTLSELRSWLRRWIGHDDAQPLIASGHQIELYHPGVWVKDVLANEAARALGGAAYHFAIDTDAPKHLQLRWPGGARPITDDARLGTADWAGILEMPSASYLAEVRRKLRAAAAGWEFEPLADRVLGAMARLTLESSNLTWVLTNSLHQLDWDLGLRHHSLLASPIWNSTGYLLFVHHLLAGTGTFAAAYNAILDRYRLEEGIRNPGRPWPNLHCAPEGCEVPFWLDNLETGQRLRASLQRTADGWLLQSGNERFIFDARAEGWAAAESLGKFLAAQALRLSPRAVTLTVFLRLLVADQFIHGIGGARYDQVTDCMISRWFGLRPPGFAVATATLLFPGAAHLSRLDVPALEQETRRIAHGARDPEKRRLAAEIESLPRRSLDRRRLFFRMHDRLDAIRRSEQFAQWQLRLERAREEAVQQREIFDRELFYALQPAHRLEELIARFQGRFSAAR